jgi:hypothetical protein
VAKEWTVRILVGLIGLGKMTGVAIFSFIGGLTNKNFLEIGTAPITFSKEVFKEVKDLSKL